MMIAALSVIILLISYISQGFYIKVSSKGNNHTNRLKMSAAVGSIVPEGITVDIISSTDGAVCESNEAKDLGALLKSQRKVVLFAVPGAFTPTCSAQHLPGFVANVAAIKAKGVEDIYCLSVNDRFVMRSWAEGTPGCVASGIKMVADGNGEFIQALGLSKDASGSRMGLRSKRFAAIIESGKFTLLNIDEKGMVTSSAESVLAAL